MSKQNPFYSILPEATLVSAVEEFACGTHRGKKKRNKIGIRELTYDIVCVLNYDGSIKGILSQSTIAKYLYENQRHFPDIEVLMNKTVREKKKVIFFYFAHFLSSQLRQLGLGESDVIAVSADSPVLDALELMSMII